ncbi:hypothetical protein [Planktothrix agardhii]|jgi:hypothetical protein|uniref:Uncharacterized protein n=2 Tax=Planktothrix agardhii TaxID=1160 RepID=A0A073CFF3_PLAA1|nr:hypothetical protein [Planktothrix agardhii]BBD52945.1 hypothetical protein NIES204_02030 [Planktothrix agardhii NIES-204]KEI67044.1 hypothetical protein A19Y_2076 [Planktothrix agardhii NIVA-CYA 126/8]MCB8751272.1 hypothetical protein [Planktothrix agardhii 1810]MCB8760120.1 hypothetical protein [Planktothrix agardhii 1813]MCB8764092.1 hypothetical protein [Planktothrix agardhii 1809]
MVSSGTVSFLRLTAYLSIPLMVAWGVLLPFRINAQESSPTVAQGNVQMGDETATPEAQPSGDLAPLNPNDIRPLSLDSSFLSIEGGKRLMQEADSAVGRENYADAEKKFQEARQVFNQLSNFYQQLAGSFSGVDNRIADGFRNSARDTAQMRDTATYQLALLHRAKNQPELAVPLLIQIIRSQAPTRDLGKKAYQQLLELGFVTDPFPRVGSETTPPTAAQ